MSNPVASAASPAFSRELPTALFRAEQVRGLDRYAIDECGIAGILLMKRAGRAAFEALLQRWPDPQQITVMCGAGNNAGDGYVIAGLAAQRRIPVEVLYLSDPHKLRGDARQAFEFARREGVIAQPFAEAARFDGIVVDAMLGTGLAGDVRETYRTAITGINASRLPVLSVDIPTGLCSDTGRELGLAVRADVTVTFIGLKQGLFTGRGPALCGDILYADLQVPAPVFDSQPVSSRRLDLASLLQCLPQRAMDAHKGNFGHVLVVGGDRGFAGATAMAAEAAARVGAGLTSVATRPEHVSAVVSRRPELMVLGVESGAEIEPLLARASVVVAGPGLGTSAWSEQLLQRVLARDIPVVLDADAINLLAARASTPEPRQNCILTPHPGEAARLLGCTTADIQGDRFAAATEIRQRYGGTVVLKGSGSILAGRDGGLTVCTAGNPGMATGGMGDVLSGVTGGLLAQRLDQDLAVGLAVGVHARAADVVAGEYGQRGLLATDLIPEIRSLLNPELGSELGLELEAR